MVSVKSEKRKLVKRDNIWSTKVDTYFLQLKTVSLFWSTKINVFNVIKAIGQRFKLC